MTKPSVSQSSPVPRHSSADASASTVQEGAESADQSHCGAAGALEHLREVDRRHLWHAFTPMRTYVPFIIERAEGFELIDVDGRRYLDAESSLWCSVHGHGEPHIDAAIRAQLDRVAHVTLLGMTSDTTVRLTEQLLQRAPGFERVFYSSDGACAVEVALKLAFEYWHRIDPGTAKRKFLSFDAAYHGDTIGTLSVGGIDRFNRVFSPLFYDVIRGPCPDSYRPLSEDSTADALELYLTQARGLIAAHAGELAAVVIEPLVQCAAGIVTHPPGFLQGVAECCREHGVLLIADEIAVGCGRTGTWIACSQENVTPDLLCLGKGLSAGYLPLAATLVSPRIAEAFEGTDETPGVFCHGHTFGGNPLACAAALASLELIDRNDVLENVRERSRQLLDALAPLRAHPHVGDIRGRGLAIAVELVEEANSKRRFAASRRVGQRVCERATAAGVWLRPLQNIVVLMPPLAIDASNIERIAHVLIASVEAELGGA